MREIILVEESKLSPVLGTNRPVPVETVPSVWKAQKNYLEKIGAQVSIRKTGMSIFSEKIRETSSSTAFWPDKRPLSTFCPAV